jgi:cbb3-type cytochrome oxidase subunit 1
MVRIDVAFLVLAAACLIAGVSLGIVMGILHDFRFAPVHGHLNLLGWASLAIFGIAYRLYPALQRSRMALPHLVLSGVSGVLLPLGIYVSIAHEAPGLAILASFLWLGGAVLFLANLLVSLVFQGGRVHAQEAGLAMGR